MVGLNVLPIELLKEASGVLVVVSSAEESAKRIESHLRNAGHPLRTIWISGLAELGDVLRRDKPDLLLCEDTLTAAPLDNVVGLCTKLCPELPLLVLTQNLGAATTAEALVKGLQDCVSIRNPAHLRHLERVVMRELINHHHLRELDSTRQRLQEYESRHQQLTEGTQDAVAHVQEGILVGANAAFIELLGHDDIAPLIGTPMIDLVMPKQQNRLKDRLRKVFKGEHDDEPLELTLRTSSGQLGVKANLMLGSTDGESVIEMLVRSEGTPGRSGVKNIGPRIKFARALGAPAPEGLLRAALLIKIDHYAELEDRIGMIDAEEIRAQLGEAVRARLEPRDSLFIFSNDELALAVLRPDIGGIEALAQALRNTIGQQVYATRRHEAQIMLSAAIYPMGAKEQIETVLQQLVGEVRKLSREGGDRICVLGEAAEVKVAEREQNRIAADVKLALEQSRLRLSYQYIASLEGESQSRFDVLLSMIDETDNEFSAGEFLPQAQAAGLMIEIDRWVVARILGVIHERGPEQILFVKLSEDSIRDAEGFLSWFKDQVQQQPLPENSIVMALQEQAVQNHMRKAKALTRALNELGVDVALEHYGMGANSAQLLDHISVQYLKFHPDFTRRFNDKAIQRKLVELMGAAKQHQLKTIVVHVEDAGIMARMWQMGVSFIQGYHVQQPEVVLLSGEAVGRRV